MIRLKSSIGNRCTRLRRVTPALLTRVSRWPYVDTAVSTAAAH